MKQIGPRFVYVEGRAFEKKVQLLDEELN